MSALCELTRLRELSARLGSNPLLTQASSGNTSLKSDGVLWIKASGKWLIQAEADDFWIPISLEEAQRCGWEDRAIQKTTPDLQGPAKASLETAMHAAIPQAVVIHVHSVNTIAWAVREDGPQQLSARLSGLAWQWIPYASSGAPLARKIGWALACAPATEVFVLGNHGLVVSGSSCFATEQLLMEVEQRLAIQPRYAPISNGNRLQQTLPSNLAKSLALAAEVHSLATDPLSRRILADGVLYPCQALFLPGVSAWASSLPVQELDCEQRTDFPLATALAKGQQSLACLPETRAEQEMLIGLANVVQRIDPAAPLRYLTAREVREVLGSTGDQYRRSVATNGIL